MRTIDYFGTEKASLKGFCNFYRNNIPLIIVVTAALFFTYGIKLCFYSVGYDTVGFMVDKSSMIKINIQMGRPGLALLQRIWYIWEFNPIAAFFVAFCFIWLFTLSWCYVIALFNKNTGRNNYLIPFAMLFMTSAIWAETFYHVYQAVELTAMIAFCPYIIYVFYKGFLENRKREIAVSTVLLVFIFLVYEGILPIFIAGVFVCFILLQEHSEYEPRIYNGLCLKLFITLVTAVILKILLAKLVAVLFHLEASDYVSSMMKWGTKPLYKNIGMVLTSGYMITIGNIPAVQKIAEPLMAKFAGHGMDTVKFLSNSSRVIANILLLPIAIIFIIEILRLARHTIPSGRRLLYALAGIGVPFCIILLSIASGNIPRIRTLWALPFTSAFMFFFLILKTQKIFRRMIIILALVSSLYQAEITAQLWYSDYIRYQDDVHLAWELERIISSVSSETTPLPIALVGGPRTAITANFLRGDVLGRSLFEVVPDSPLEGSTHGIEFMKSLGISYVEPSEAQMDTARQVSVSMPCYPYPGCVQRLGDVIVVKLSESTYRP